MEKRDALPLRANAGRFIDKPEANVAAALQSAVEIIHRETHVVDAGTPSGEVFANGRVVGRCLEELHQRVAGRQPCNGGTVGIVQWNLWHTENITVERKQLVKGTHGDPDVGDACTAAYGIGHGRRCRCGRERIPNSNPADGRDSNR